MCASSPLAKEAGTIIDDRYEIVSLLGVGGMSSVYRVHDRELNREVALKMLHPHLTEQHNSAQRIIKEAKAEGLIRHPNVISVLSVNATSAGHVYIVMEYLQGASLADSIKDGAIKDQERCLDLFLQMCRGLRAAHAMGIVHRDLKPGNIMLCDDGRTAKIVDFGIALLYDDTNREQRLTRDSAIVGSPEYMSPEQCEGKPLDVRSDIYSLGCLMYEVLTGAVPFTGDNAIETMCKQVGEVPKNAIEIAPWTAAAFTPILAKCMEKNPVERYQTIDELLMALQSIDLADTTSHILPTATISAPHAVVTGSRSKRVKTAILFVASLAIAFGVGIATKKHEAGTTTRVSSAEAILVAAKQSVEKAKAVSGENSAEYLSKVIAYADLLQQAGLRAESAALYRELLESTRILGTSLSKAVAASMSIESVKANVFLALGQLYLNQNSTDSAVHYFDRALRESVRMDKYSFVELKVAAMLRKHDNYELALNHLDKALTSLKNNEDPQKLDIHKEIADCYWYLRNYDKAADEYREAARLAKQQGSVDPQLLGQVLHGLGLSEYFRSNYQQAEIALRQEVDLHARYNNAEDVYQTVEAFTRLGDSLRYQRRHAEAAKEFKDALKLITKTSDSQLDNLRKEVTTKLRDCEIAANKHT